MGQIDFTKFREGDTPDATGLNAPYDDLAAVSIEKENTKPNWATRAHFDDTGEKANELFFYDYDGVSAFQTTNTNYQTITNAGNPSRITFPAGTSMDGAHIIRAGASGIIGDIICNTDGDGDGTQDSYNYFSFRLLVTYNVGGGNLTDVIAECGYSYTRRSRLTNDSTGLDSALWWRNFSFSGLWAVPNNNTQIISIELQAKVGPNGGSGNQLDVTRNNINAVLVRN